MSYVTHLPKFGPLLECDTEFLCPISSLPPGKETTLESVVFPKSQVIHDSSLPYLNYEVEDT